MMFYNGFNLMIDVILCGLVGWIAYRMGWAGGYSEGEQDYAEYSERAGEYWLEQEREREH